jgi:hypothetical protein
MSLLRFWESSNQSFNLILKNAVLRVWFLLKFLLRIKPIKLYSLIFFDNVFCKAFCSKSSWSQSLLNFLFIFLSTIIWVFFKEDLAELLLLLLSSKPFILFKHLNLMIFAFLVYRLLSLLSFWVLMLKVVVVVQWLGSINCTADSKRCNFILLLNSLGF